MHCTCTAVAALVHTWFSARSEARRISLLAAVVACSTCGSCASVTGAAMVVLRSHVAVPRVRPAHKATTDATAATQGVTWPLHTFATEEHGEDTRQSRYRQPQPSLGKPRADGDDPMTSTRAHLQFSVIPVAVEGVDVWVGTRLGLAALPRPAVPSASPTAATKAMRRLQLAIVRSLLRGCSWRLCLSSRNPVLRVFATGRNADDMACSRDASGRFRPARPPKCRQLRRNPQGWSCRADSTIDETRPVKYGSLMFDFVRVASSCLPYGHH